MHDQVDGPHVDAELERGRRHQPAEPAFLQRILDVDALRPGERSVVGADQRLAGGLMMMVEMPLALGVGYAVLLRAALRPRGRTGDAWLAT